VIDVSNERLYTFSQAVRFLPRSAKGKKRSTKTLYRYALNGLRGVRLEWVQAGGCRCTSREAIHRFYAALTGQMAKPPPTNGVAEAIAAGERLKAIVFRSKAGGLSRSDPEGRARTAYST